MDFSYAENLAAKTLVDNALIDRNALEGLKDLHYSFSLETGNFFNLFYSPENEC